MKKSDATRQTERLEHLAQVRALSQAIASAISAIEKNDLKNFQVHVALQETICNRLCGMRAIRLSRLEESAATFTEIQLQEEILRAHLQLRQLNRVYGELLKRVRKSTELIAALYRSHRLGYNRGPFSLQNLHSWSCEV